MLTKYLKGDSCLPVLPRFPVFLSTALSKRQTLTELFHFITESFIKHWWWPRTKPYYNHKHMYKDILPAHNLWYVDLSFLSLTWPLTVRECVLNWNQSIKFDDSSQCSVSCTSVWDSPLKNEIRPSFTHPRVIPNQYDFPYLSLCST